MQQNFHSVVAPAARQAYDASQGLDDGANADGVNGAAGRLAGAAQQGALPQDGQGPPPGAAGLGGVSAGFGGVPQMPLGFPAGMAGMEGLLMHGVPGMAGMPPGWTLDAAAFAQMQAHQAQP